MTERDRGDNFSLLSDVRILEYLDSGNILIDPFDQESLGNASYDVRLGRNYYRPEVGGSGQFIYNPWDEESVTGFWGEPQKAVKAASLFSDNLPSGILEDDEVIMIRPGELLLCHTEEFIGGVNGITTMMKARSSVGRTGIAVCKCAGWGDVGYTNRWTMEIHSSLPLPVPLVVGRRMAQITFFEVGPVRDGGYSQEGKYQSHDSIEELRDNWEPTAMLPKMWLDREVGK